MYIICTCNSIKNSHLGWQVSCQFFIGRISFICVLIKSFWQSCFTLIAFLTGHGMRSHYTFQSSVLNAYAMNFTSFIKPVFKGIIDICMNLDLYVLHIRTWLLLRYTWFTSCWLNFSTWITALCGCITGSAPPPPPKDTNDTYLFVSHLWMHQRDQSNLQYYCHNKL